ncbi:hypothetical protein [Thermospira aquatica]|uniref:Lipoprotein n=1 Tax=Thermospira aquatica TaxID=2828656 RepID=A0AAX3BDI3_9SPIR|nr:hypothetical protein [Thermospira aquatica]URA10188.1 hypothetical protein KDW03_12025 [Thermospira aquatica]
MKRWHVIVFWVFLVTGCGIESFEQEISLNPPLGLEATVDGNGDIELSFWGMNNEPYFEGYNIYIAAAMEDALQDRGGRLPGPSENQATIPNISVMNEAKRFTYTVTKNTNGDPLQSGVTYFFYVKAYSAQYNVQSPRSNITNATKP